MYAFRDLFHLDARVDIKDLRLDVHVMVDGTPVQHTLRFHTVGSLNEALNQLRNNWNAWLLWAHTSGGEGEIIEEIGGSMDEESET